MDTLKQQIQDLFDKRKDRVEHPAGSFDRQGRWFPAQEETQDCCRGLRSPSRAWPYSLLLHCRTKKHCQNLILSQQIQSEIAS